MPTVIESIASNSPRTYSALIVTRTQRLNVCRLRAGMSLLFDWDCPQTVDQSPEGEEGNMDEHSNEQKDSAADEFQLDDG